MKHLFLLVLFLSVFVSFAPTQESTGSIPDTQVDNSQDFDGTFTEAETVVVPGNERAAQQETPADQRPNIEAPLNAAPVQESLPLATPKSENVNNEVLNTQQQSQNTVPNLRADSSEQAKLDVQATTTEVPNVAASQDDLDSFLRVTPTRPIVSDLKGTTRTKDIRLTWTPYQTDDSTNVSYTIYRSPEPININTFNLAQNIGFVGNGTTVFDDVPVAPGDYYYAVFVAMNGSDIPIFSPGENLLTTPIAYAGLAGTAEDLYGVSDWTQVKKGADIAANTQESNLFEVQAQTETQRQAPPAAPQKPINVIINVPEKNNNEYDKYLKLIEEQNRQLEQLKQQTQNLLLDKQKQELNAQKEMALKRDQAKAKEKLAQEKEKQAKEQREQLKKLYPQVVIEILSEEKQRASNEYEYRLQVILHELIANQDWQNAQNELLDLLRYSNFYSDRLRARIAFYRGQIFYVFARYDSAMLEFLAAKQFVPYERDAIRWIQKVKFKGA